MAILCKHADIFFLLLQQLQTKSGGGFSSSSMMPVGDLKCKNRDFFKAISRNFQNFEMQNNNCLFGRVKKKQKHILRKGVKTDTNCKRRRGHLGSPGVRGVLPKVTATLLKQHHQSPITCPSPTLRSEQIHVSGKGQILACALAQLDSLPLTQCQTGPSCSTLLQRWVDEKFVPDLSSAPSSPEWDHHLPLHTLSVSAMSQTYLGSCQVSELAGLRRDNWMWPSVTTATSALTRCFEMALVSVQSQTWTRRHRGSPSREPFRIFSLPNPLVCRLFHELMVETTRWLVFLNQIRTLYLPVCLRFPVRHKRNCSVKISQLQS